MLAVLLAVAVLLLAGATSWAAWAAAQPRVMKARMRHRVVVTLKDGGSFDGVLWETDSRVWVLRNAVALGAGDRDADVPVDGEVLVMVADVAYAQRP